MKQHLSPKHSLLQENLHETLNELVASWLQLSESHQIIQTNLQILHSQHYCDKENVKHKMNMWQTKTYII